MWLTLAVDGLLGAAAGALGWLLTRRLRPKGQKAMLTRVVLVVAAISVGNQIVVPRIRGWQQRRELYRSGLEVYGNAEAARALVELMGPIIQDPRLRAWIERQPTPGAGPAGPSGGASLSALSRLTIAGVSRLEPADAEVLFDTRGKLAQLSPALCSGFWTGELSQDALADGLRRLDVAQQRAWIAASARATSLALAATTPAPQVSKAASEAAMSSLLAKLDPAAKAAFVKASGAGPLTPADTCAAFRALADGAKKLDPDTRAVFIRSVTGPDNGGP